MKAVILAGGLGTRMAEETEVRPKPMVEIGGRPILWHIMKTYAAHGVRDFIVCLGYKGYVIKEYFANMLLHQSDLTIDLGSNDIEIHQKHIEPWRVTLVDTGKLSMTGGRLKRVAPYLAGESRFCMTYGDGVSDIDVTALIAFHEQHGLTATLTAVQPPGRFGALSFHDDGVRIAHFQEKPQGDHSWINGGYFVLDASVLDYIEDDDTIWEKGPLERLAAEGQLASYKHAGFWHPMDTLRDKRLLERYWANGEAAWKVW